MGAAKQTVNLEKAAEAAALVHLDTGLIDRRIFVEDDIYRLELEQIFARCWLYLCHESEIPNAGDYVTGHMGADPVIVTRARNGKVNAFINSCRHRGNTLCRADRGNTKTFVCSYHGWAYDTDGKLVGVPGIKDYYHDELDRKEWGLPKVAQVASYRGLIFGTFDPDAPPLEEYLGDMRWGLDLILNQGDLIAAPGIARWSMEGNWKFASDNAIGDMYHGPTSHRSGIMSGHKGGGGAMRETHGSDNLADTMTMFRNDRGFTVVTEYGHGLNANYIDPERFDTSSPLMQWRNDPAIMAKMGELGSKVARGNMLVFPNLFVNFGSRELMLRNPLGPTKIEILKTVLIDRNAPPEVQRMQVRASNRHFGPAGVFEQDDGENWDQSTVGCLTPVSQRYPLHYAMGKGHGQVEPSHNGEPTYVKSLMNEHAQLWMYRVWAEFMAAPNWPHLRANHSRPEGVL